MTTLYLESRTEGSWFQTLNDALESEGLLHTWHLGMNAINYNETFQFTHDNGTKYGHLISIHRNERGLYERPTHYNR